MNIDWQSMMVPSTSVLELILRGTLMYFGLLAVLRVLVRRHVGSMSIMDLLLMVLIADAAQNAMSNEYRSLTEGFILCGTLVGWNYLLDWLAYRFPAFEKILEPEPLPVVRDGKLIRRNLRAEYITPDEVHSQLRQQEVHDISEVALAYLEPDGGLSVKRYKQEKRKIGGRSNENSALR